MRHNETVDNFEKWTNQWQKALDDGIFDDAPRPPFMPPDEGEETYDFGQKASVKTHDVDAEYWSRMQKLSQGNEYDPLDEPDHSSLSGEEMVDISEDDDSLVPTEKPDGKSNRKITDELGPTPNPTNTTNRGVDNRSHVTPNWAGGKKIIELHNMKLNLYKLESKLAADPMMADKKSKGIAGQIKELWQKIDQLSDSLAPNYTTEYQD